MALNRTQERELIEQAAAGDRAAAAMIITSYQQSLYAYLLRLTGRPDVAEDICQDAFVRVLTNLHRFDPRYRFSTWLFTIARRLWVNACQKHKPAYDTDVVSASGGRGESPEAPVVGVEVNDNARDALQRALMQLNETQREVVVLFHQMDWPIALIARHMGMPEGTVKSHLHRGRRRLRVLLDVEESSTAVDEVWS